MNLLEVGPVRRVRQHHAVEHATITILMSRNPGLPLVGGRSDHRGFYVYGPVQTSVLATAVQEALKRLKAGEARLAIHPNCGTNLVTTGALAGIAAMTATAVARYRRASVLDQIPAAILAATGAVVASRPIGLRLQRQVTTRADVSDLQLGEITRRELGRLVQHFVALVPAAG
ncbi:MAG: DUF6391 domain-containing protein [Caldilineales bacterium]